MEPKMLDEDEFWPLVAKTEGDECWEWTAARNGPGYGIIPLVINGKRTSMGAHRRAWELAKGPIPGGMHVLHSCDNPPCCNPAHLWLGTHAQNMQDMVAKGRAGTRTKTGGRKRRSNAAMGNSRPDIKSVEDVVREHIQNTVAANPNVPQYVLAVGLGWSPSTLCRRLQLWAREAGAETLVGDRR